MSNFDLDLFVKSINKNAKHQQDLIQHAEGVCKCIPAGTHGSTPHLLKTVVSVEPLKIRKLTEVECFKLMGFTVEDARRCADNGLSKTQIYRVAGNSIVVNVLEAIFISLGERYEEFRV